MTATLEDLLGQIEGIVGVQDERYGPFEATVSGARLGIAVLEDEVAEALLAWREARGELMSEGFPRHEYAKVHALRTEIMQVAAVAVRLLRDMGDPREALSR